MEWTLLCLLVKQRKGFENARLGHGERHWGCEIKHADDLPRPLARCRCKELWWRRRQKMVCPVHQRLWESSSNGRKGGCLGLGQAVVVRKNGRGLQRNGNRWWPLLLLLLLLVVQ